MRTYIASVLLAASALICLPVKAECSYCDSWRAFSGDPYFPNSVVTLSEKVIVLPSCEPVQYEIVRSTPSHQFGAACTDHFFAFERTPECKKLSAQMLKPFVQVTTCPGTQWGNEELGVALYREPNHPVGYDPQFFGASWRLIRQSYDPCESGGGRGLWMCSLFALEQAERRLEELSQSIPPASQKRWRNKRDSLCSQNEPLITESWAYREEERCRLRLTEKRISDLHSRASAQRRK